MRLRYLLIFIMLLGVIKMSAQEKKRIKVACIGNSITQGVGTKNQHKDSYPGVLSQLLGPDYEVRNFGLSGRTLQMSCESPYMKERAYFKALDFNPDIVTIKLGTNDSRYTNWVGEKPFIDDYEELIKSFEKLPSKPKIYLCLPVPSEPNRFEIVDSILVNCVIPAIQKVAKKNKLPVIDLYTPLKDYPTLFPDKVHPNENGAIVIAQEVYKGLTGVPAHDYKSQEFQGVKSQFVLQSKPKVVTDKYDFVFNGNNVTIFTPTEDIAGKPWVWHPFAFESISPIDKYMLGSGFHVVYGEIDNDMFNVLKKEYGFNGKFVIDETFNNMKWLNRNMDKVACYINGRRESMGFRTYYEDIFMESGIPVIVAAEHGYTMAADFAIRNQPEYKKYNKFNKRGSLQNTYTKLSNGQTVNIAFVGASMPGMNGWRNIIAHTLSKQFPQATVNIIQNDTLKANSTIDSDYLSNVILARNNIDLLFIDEAICDYDSIDFIQQSANIEEMICDTWSENPNTDIVMIHSASDKFVKLLQKNHIPDVVYSHERVVDKYNVPTINIATEVAERISRKEFTWDEFAMNRWPNLGLNFTSRAIMNLFDQMWKKNVLQIVPHEMPDKGCGNL